MIRGGFFEVKVIKAKAKEKKVKIAELLAEAEFMEKNRMVDIEVERLDIQEKVAKA